MPFKIKKFMTEVRRMIIWPVGYVLKVHKNLGDDIKALGIRIHNFNSISLFFFNRSADP